MATAGLLSLALGDSTLFMVASICSDAHPMLLGIRLTTGCPRGIKWSPLKMDDGNRVWRMRTRSSVGLVVGSTLEESMTCNDSLGIAGVLKNDVSLPKWREGLWELIVDIRSGRDLKSTLDPWINSLSTEEWNKIIAEVGDRDWNIAMSVFSVFKETLKSPLSEASSVNHASDIKIKSCLLTGYTTLIRVLAKHERVSEIKVIVRNASEDEIEADLFFYNVLAQAYATFGLIHDVAQVFILMESNGLQPDHFSYEAMIAAFLNSSVPELDKAMGVFRTMLSNNMRVGSKTIDSLIAACVKSQNIVAGEEAFLAMTTGGYNVHSKTWGHMIKLHANVGGYLKAEGHFQRLKAAGCQLTASAYDALLFAYCKAARVDQAFSVFREYKLAAKPSLVAYNWLIDACGKCGRHEECLALYAELSSNGLRPSVVTYNSLLCALVKASEYEQADRLYQKMLQENILPSAYICSTMINAYSCAGRTKSGHEVCTKLRSCNTVTPVAVYGSMLKLYVRGRWYKEAANVLKEMETLNIEPDIAGYGVLISALKEMGPEITQLKKAVEMSEFEPLKAVHSLLDMSFSDSGSEPQVIVDRLSNVMEIWALKFDERWNRSIYNAFLDALWTRGLRGRAQLLMVKARQLFPWYNRPRSEEMDVRGLSVGGAQVALLDWLHTVVNSRVGTLKPKMVLITGGDLGSTRTTSGKSKRLGAVKQAISGYLEEMCSPFNEKQHKGSVQFEADTLAVVKWMSKREIKDALSLFDQQ